MRNRAAVVLALALALTSTAPPVLADDRGGAVKVSTTTWTGSSGYGYVEFQVSTPGQPPTSVPPKRSDTQSPYYMTWSTYWNQIGQDRGWLGGGLSCSYTIYRRSDDSIVIGGLAPCDTPTVGVPPLAAGGTLTSQLGVSITPESGPANTDRTVYAQVSNTAWAAVSGALSGWVDPSSVRITSWDVDYGDGTRATYSSGGALELTEVHKYGAGQFTAAVTAHMAGTVIGAYFDSSGNPYEATQPFTLTLTNTAGTGGSAIEYVPPVVTVGSDPTVEPTPSEPNLPTVPRGKALASFYWMRGLSCTLYAAPIVVSEGFMRSAGVRIGGASTYLASYDFSATVNDRNARVRTPNGNYAGNAPIEIQWNTPLGNNTPYVLSYTYHLVTTYADGTVRDYTVTGSVAVVIVYTVMG